MTGVPSWLLILGAIPAAWLAIRLSLKGLRGFVHFWVRFEKAISVINYELVPNGGKSLLDKVDEALRVGIENQRGLENHLLAHGWDPPAAFEEL